MPRRLFLSVVIPACVLITASPARPATLLQMTTEQMTSAATAIVRGTVTGSSTAMSGRTIFTHYTVQVAERWKGPVAVSIDVAVPGGALNGVHQTFIGVPALQTGKQYLLFLWAGSSGPTQLVGLTQGLFHVDAGSSGQNTVWRPATGEMMINAGGKPVRDQPVSMQLGTMRARVWAILGGTLQ